MKVTQKISNDNNRRTSQANQNSGQNPLAQVSLDSGTAAGQRELIDGIKASPRMVAQRRQLEGYTQDNRAPKDITPSQQGTKPRPNKTGLPDNLKSGIEALSGFSMDNVRVHYNSSKPTQINALAYAQGTDIHLASGQEQHLPHEAWHVVQQAQGRVAPTKQMQEGDKFNDDKGLEYEADAVGKKLLANVAPSQAESERQEMLQGMFAPMRHTESFENEMIGIISINNRHNGLSSIDGSRRNVRSSSSISVMQLKPNDFINSPVLTIQAGLQYRIFGKATPWSSLQSTVSLYSTLDSINTTKRRSVLTQMDNDITGWESHHKIGVVGHSLKTDEKNKVDVLNKLKDKIQNEREDCDDIENRVFSKLGRFDRVGEGLMTANNMVGGNFTVPGTHPRVALLQQHVDRWSSYGFDEVGHEGINVAALNDIFRMHQPVDTGRHRNELIEGYRRLAASKTPIGRELADLLQHSGPYNITLTDASGLNNYSKQVDLKLIIQPGIPGQFLSPFEQGMTLADCIASANPLPAVIMWDPLLNFEYFKSRTPGDDTKAENDPTRRGTRETMEAWVVLGHELGHFKDFLDRPNKYGKKLASGKIHKIEEWNLPREQELVRVDLGKTPRRFYLDFPGGKNAGKLDLL